MVGVAAFEESLRGYGRMGVDVRIGESWLPWPVNADDVQRLLQQLYAPALAAVTTPYDILDALEAGVIERDGIRIGKSAAGRPANLVNAVILAEHLGEHGRAETSRAAARALQGVPFPWASQDGEHGDQWVAAQGWARNYGRAIGRPVRL